MNRTHTGLMPGDAATSWTCAWTRDSFPVLDGVRVDEVAAVKPRDPAPDTKPTNPKDAIGVTKLPLHLVSPIVKAYQAVAHYLGNVKYGAHNYVVCGARASVYKAACDRHMDAWWAGEEFDPADGTPHLANAMACIGILIETFEAGNLTDDRPPSTAYSRVRAKLEPIMAKILAQHGDKRPRHYSIQDTVT